MNNQPPPGPPGLDREREREIEEHHMRERERQARLQQEEMAQRERDHQERERQHREQYQAPQHQNSAGAIPLHQPVANRLGPAIHSPGGLLANHGGVPPPNPLGAPSGPGNAFGGPLHGDANRSLHQQQNPSQQHMFGQAINHAAQQQSAQMGAQGAQGPFGGPLPQEAAAARSIQQIPFGNGMGGHPAAGAQALGQGQQPILNVSYLSFLA